MPEASVDGLPEQTRREATPHSEWTNDSCRTHAQSHAATVPPSNGATGRSSASQKAQTVYLASYNITFREKIYIRRCCIDLLRPPRLSSKWTIIRGAYHTTWGKPGLINRRSDLRVVPSPCARSIRNHSDARISPSTEAVLLAEDEEVQLIAVSFILSSDKFRTCGSSSWSARIASVACQEGYHPA